jgi:hypothetical protein
VCPLGALGAGLAATVRVVTSVHAGGTLLATAALATVPAAANPAAAVTSVTTTVVPAPPPPLPAPVLAQVRGRSLPAATRGRTATVIARFRVNEAVRLTMRVTRRGSRRPLALLPGTRLAGTTARSRRPSLEASVGRAGAYPLRAVLARSALARGGTYVIRLVARNGDGVTAALGIRFTLRAPRPRSRERAGGGRSR